MENTLKLLLSPAPGCWCAAQEWPWTAGCSSQVGRLTSAWTTFFSCWLCVSCSFCQMCQAALQLHGNMVMKNIKYFPGSPPQSHSVFFWPTFSVLGNKFHFFIIQLWQEKAHNNGQIMSNSLMLVLGDALLVVFLLGPKPSQLRSLLFRIRVSEAKQLMVI